MFTTDEQLRFTYENFDNGQVQIHEASVCSIFEIGGDAACFEPDITSYQECRRSSYSYGWDYVVLVKRFLEGYFIGDIGYNNVDTPFASTCELVYNLYEIWLNIGYDDGEEPTEFLLLFEYLLRHCKNNNCVQLQLKLDDKDRYRLFYDYVKAAFGMTEQNGYLFKKIC